MDPSRSLLRRAYSVYGRVALSIGFLAGGGCALFQPRKAPVVPPPAMQMEVSSFPGSPLSGPTGTKVPDFSATDATQVDVVWMALQKVPDNALLPLDAQAALTSAPFSSGPILTVGHGTRFLRFGTGEASRSFLDRLHKGEFGTPFVAGVQSGLIVPGSSLRIRNRLPATKETPDQTITLSLGRPTPEQVMKGSPAANQGTLSVGVEGLAPETKANAGDDAGARNLTGPEYSYLDNLSLADGEHLVLLTPCKLDDTPWKVLIADIAIRSVANDAEGLAAVESLRASLDGGVTGAATRASTNPIDGEQPTLDSAIEVLKTSRQLRSPLLFLSTATDAMIARDFVLVCNDALLGQLRDAVLQYASAQPTSTSREGLQWLLDRSSLSLMCEQAANETSAPELASVMVANAGEVGRQPDTIKELLKAVANSGDLKLRLIGENVIALEDSSPAARVRAFDWLTAQGKAPAGYDPLGDAKSRRNAINNATSTQGGVR